MAEFECMSIDVFPTATPTDTYIGRSRNTRETIWGAEVFTKVNAEQILIVSGTSSTSVQIHREPVPEFVPACALGSTQIHPGTGQPLNQTADKPLCYARVHTRCNNGSCEFMQRLFETFGRENICTSEQEHIYSV